MAGRLFVLVVTTDPRLERQALCAVRAAGCLPMLGHDDEECLAALRRTLPDAVLLDTTHPRATSEEFFEEAAAMGVRVIGLASNSRNDVPPSFARPDREVCLTLPAEYDLAPARLRPAELT